MRILFHEYTLNLRGTSQAVYDYAHYAETLLGHEAVIFYDAASPENDAAVIAKFQARFRLLPYSGDFEARIAQVCREEQIDLSYFLKSGEWDGRLSPVTANAVHVVFQRFDPHGDAYAYVSPWLSKMRSGGLYPHVPHIVDLPPVSGHMREDLQIPEDAYVFGRYGGASTFDLDFVKQGLVDLLEDPRVWCVFVNTDRFIDHPRVLFLDPITRPEDKSRFIATCDAMIHARKRGESFGLAISEFLFHNKPVLAWRGGKDGHHRTMLAPLPGALYRDRQTFVAQARAFVGGAAEGADWAAAVAPFAPEPVMQAFDHVFVRRAHGPVPPPRQTWRHGAQRLRVNAAYQICRRVMPR